MKITDIKQQIKRAGRYSIYADGRYVFSLSEPELMESGLRIGREYTVGEFEQLQQRAVIDKAYMRALDLLARRARSQWEMRDYLKRKDYPLPVIELILNKLSKQGYLDDQQFAQAWLANRRLLKATSLRRLRLELQQKHILDEIITNVLAADTTSDRQALQDLVTKKRRQTKYQDNLKLMQYLARQGFNYDDIKTALSEEQ